MFKKLICWIIGHDWYRGKRLYKRRRYHCNRCSEIDWKYVGDPVKITRFDDGMIANKDN